MIYVMGLLAVVFFLSAFERFGVTRAAAKAIKTSRVAARSIRDRTMTDIEKEGAMRRASLSLILDFVSIGVRGVGAVGASLLPLFGAELVGLASFTAVMSWFATWEAVTLITVLVALWYLVTHRS